MQLQKIHLRFAVVLAIILVIAGIRLLNNFSTHITPLANYSPLGAMALFGGAYFKGRIQPYIIPLLVLLMSDFILFLTVHKSYGNGFLYDGWYWVYGSYVLMGVAGKMIIRKISVRNIAMAIFVSVFIHWVISDFGMWQSSNLYPYTSRGLADCLTAAIPFELRLLTATIVYSTIMFGTFEWLRKRYPVLQTA